MDQQLLDQNNTEDQRQLAHGVVLYKKYEAVDNDPEIVGIFTWKLEISVLSCIDFEVDLEQSENIHLDNAINNELKTISKIQPFETKVVARVILKNNWKLKSRFKLIMTIPDKPSQYRHIEKYDKALQAEIADFNSKLGNIPFEHLSIDEAENILKEKGIKFIDMEFPPTDQSALKSIRDGTLKECFDYVLHWKRAEEIVPQEGDNPKHLTVFSSPDVQPDDMNQGLLFDNHLLSAFSALAEKYNLIKRLFKSDKYSKYGIYQVKLCINGEWVTIVVDDLFPCIPLSKPLVSENDSKDLWLLILEKAMAKAYESYYNLTLYNIVDFLHVLTGCPTLYYKVDDLLKKEKEEDLLKRLYNNVIEKKYLVVAISRNYEEEDTENNEANDNETNKMLTVGNFGYTVIDVKQKYQENLIVVRKVWNDDSKKEILQNYITEFIKAYPDTETCFEKDLVLKVSDFIREFDSFAVCYAKNWDEVRVRGKFVQLSDKNNYETTLSKWYYFIQLEKVTNIVISLFQDDDSDRDLDSRKQLMDISFTILKKESNKTEISHMQTLDFRRESNIQMELNLPVGQYIILPRTSGCFFGRPFNKTDIKKLQLYDYSNKKYNPVFINTIKDIFKKFDLLLNRKLGFNEFKGFYECVNKLTIDEEWFKENILNKFQSHEDGLTEQGFIAYFKSEFESDGGEEKVEKWLTCLGYDKELYPLKSRCFMLTFHSDNPISVSVRDALNTDLNIKVNQIILKSMGDEVKNDKDKKDVYLVQYASKNDNVVSVGCANKGSVANKITLKLQENEGLICDSKTNLYEKVIQPGTIEFLFHFFNVNNENGIEGVDYTFDYKPVSS